MSNEPSTPPPLPTMSGSRDSSSHAIVDSPLSGSKRSGCLLQVLLIHPAWTGIGGLAAIIAIFISLWSPSGNGSKEQHITEDSSKVIIAPTDFFNAISAGDVPKVKKMLEQDPSLSKKSDASGNAPLLAMWLTEYQSGLQMMEMAHALIEGGCDVNAVNPVGYYPIHFAVKSGNPTIVGSLLKKGAQISARGNSDETVVHCLAWVHDRAVLRELVNMFLSREPELMNAKTAHGCTALHYAADRANIAFATELLKFKPDPLIKDDLQEQTPLGWIQQRVSGADGVPGDDSKEAHDLLALLTSYQSSWVAKK